MSTNTVPRLSTQPSDKRASVFIATTHGLVQVQSITPLPDKHLQSVVTINGTSELAGISQKYASFVSQPQGIVQAIFGPDTYRINLSAGIDQGDSWQLGVFIAHFLFANDLLHTAKHDKQSTSPTSSPEEINNNVVFIATGRVNTLDYSVLDIQALDTKCVKANAQIQQWMQQNSKVCFIAPAANFRQPISNSVIKLTPIHGLAELPNLLSAYGLILPECSQSKSLVLPSNLLSHKSTLDANKGHHNEHAIIIEGNQVGVNQSKTKYASAQKSPSAVHLRWSFSQYSRKTKWAIAIVVSIMVMALIQLIIAFTSNNNLESHSNATTALPYALMIVKGNPPDHCTGISASIMSVGTLTRFEQAASTLLIDTCQLKIVTSTHIRSVWLVSETKAVIPLQAVGASSDEISALSVSLTSSSSQSKLYKKNDTQSGLAWHIPLPRNQSQTRRYHLLLFDYKTDQADLQSLDSFLFNMHKQNKPHTQLDLSTWSAKTQITNRLFIISQALTILPE